MNVKRVVLAGTAATAAMTMLMLAAPFMGLPKMAIGEMLGAFFGIGTAAGWVMHFGIGLTLAAIHAGAFASRLSGAPVVRGAVYGVGVFLMAQLAVSPMMGGGVFSGGNALVIAGSLLGHLVYGVLLGGIYAARSNVRQLAAT